MKAKQKTINNKFSTFFNNVFCCKLSRKKRCHFFTTSNRAFFLNRWKNRFLPFSRIWLLKGKSGEKVRRMLTEKRTFLRSGCENNTKTQNLGLSHAALFPFCQVPRRKVLLKSLRLGACSGFQVFFVWVFHAPKLTKKVKTHQNSLIWPKFARF